MGLGRDVQKGEAMRAFRGQYADNGKELRAASRAAVGHRCIRCGHPCPPMKREDRGEWTACDEHCTHGGPVRIKLHADMGYFLPNARATINIADLIRDGAVVEARWRILTVHHFDGNKENDAWWNHLSLCQRCHLQIQGKVDPSIPYFFEHSEWLKPYVAGFYAHKYEGLQITREQAKERLDELLAYELKAGGGKP